MALKSVLVKSNERPNNRLECPICKERFWLRCKYNDHIANHPQFTLSCNICSKGFNDQKLLDEHYLTHTSVIKTYDCNECPRKFLQKYQLEQHVQFHKVPFMQHAIKNKKTVTFKKVAEMKRIPPDDTSESEEFMDDNEDDDEIDEDISDIEDYLPANKIVQTRSGRTIKRKKLFDEEDIELKETPAKIEQTFSEKCKSPEKEQECNKKYKSPNTEKTYREKCKSPEKEQECNKKYKSPNKEKTYREKCKTPKKGQGYREKCKTPKTDEGYNEKCITPKPELISTGKSKLPKSELAGIGKSKSLKTKQRSIGKSPITECDSQKNDPGKSSDVEALHKEIMNKTLSVVVEKLPDHVFAEYAKKQNISMENQSDTAERNTMNNSYKVTPKKSALKSVKELSKPVTSDLAKKSDSLTTSVSTNSVTGKKSVTAISNTQNDKSKQSNVSPSFAMKHDLLTTDVSTTPKTVRKSDSKTSKKLPNKDTSVTNTPCSSKPLPISNSSLPIKSTPNKQVLYVGTKNPDIHKIKQVLAEVNTMSNNELSSGNNSPRKKAMDQNKNALNSPNSNASCKSDVHLSSNLSPTSIRCSNLGSKDTLTIAPQNLLNSNDVQNLKQLKASSVNEEGVIQKTVVGEFVVVKVTPEYMERIQRNHLEHQRIVPALNQQSPIKTVTEISAASHLTSKLNKSPISTPKKQEARRNSKTNAVASSSFPVNVINKVTAQQTSIEVPVVNSNNSEHSEILTVQYIQSPNKQATEKASVNASRAVSNRRLSTEKQETLKENKKSITSTAIANKQGKIREKQKLNTVPSTPLETNIMNNLTKTCQSSIRVQSVDSPNNSVEHSKVSVQCVQSPKKHITEIAYTSPAVSDSNKSLTSSTGKQKKLKGRSKKSDIEIEVNKMSSIKRSNQSVSPDSLTVYSRRHPKSPIIQSQTISLVHSKLPNIQSPTISLIHSKRPKIQRPSLSVVRSKAPNIQSPTISIEQSEIPDYQSPTVSVMHSEIPANQSSTPSVVHSEMQTQQSTDLLSEAMAEIQPANNASQMTSDIMNRSFTLIDGKRKILPKGRSSIANIPFVDPLEFSKSNSIKTYKKSVTPNKEDENAQKSSQNNSDELQAETEDNNKNYENKQISQHANGNLSVCSIKKEIFEVSEKSADVNSPSEVNETNNMEINPSSSFEEIPVIHNEKDESKQTLSQSILKGQETKNGAMGLFDYMKENEQKKNHCNSDKLHNDECSDNKNEIFFPNHSKKKFSPPNNKRLIITDKKEYICKKEIFDETDKNSATFCSSDVNKIHNIEINSTNSFEEIPVIHNEKDESEQTVAQSILKEPQTKNTTMGLFDYMNAGTVEKEDKNKCSDNQIEVIVPFHEEKKISLWSNARLTITADKEESVNKNEIFEENQNISATFNSSDVKKTDNMKIIPSYSFEEIPVIDDGKDESKQTFIQSILKEPQTKNATIGLYDYMNAVNVEETREKSHCSNDKMHKNKYTDNLTEIVSPVHHKEKNKISPENNRSSVTPNKKKSIIKKEIVEEPPIFSAALSSLSYVNEIDNIGINPSDLFEEIPVIHNEEEESEQILAQSVLKDPLTKNATMGLFDYMNAGIVEKEHKKSHRTSDKLHKNKCTDNSSEVSSIHNKKKKKISPHSNRRLSTTTDKKEMVVESHEATTVVNNSFELNEIVPPVQKKKRKSIKSNTSLTTTINKKEMTVENQKSTTVVNNSFELNEIVTPVRNKRKRKSLPSNTSLTTTANKKEMAVESHKATAVVNNSFDLNEIVSPVPNKKKKKNSLQSNTSLITTANKKEMTIENDKPAIIDNSFEFDDNLEACPLWSAEETVVSSSEEIQNVKKKTRRSRTKSVDKEVIDTSRSNGIKRKGMVNKKASAIHRKKKLISLQNNQASSSSSNIITQQPVKRKRGRPKKSEEKEMSNSDSLPVTYSRKKGRKETASENNQINSPSKNFYDKLLQRYKAKLEEKERKKKEKYEFKKKMKYIEKLLSSPARDCDGESFSKNVLPCSGISINDVIEISKKRATVTKENTDEISCELQSHSQSSEQGKKSSPVSSKNYVDFFGDIINDSLEKNESCIEEAIEKVRRISLKFNKDLPESEYLKLLDEIDHLILTYNIGNKCPFLNKPIRFLSHFVDSYKVRQKAISLGNKLKNVNSS